MVHKEGFQEFMDFAGYGAFISFHIYPKTRQEMLCKPSFEKEGGLHNVTHGCTLGIYVFPEK
jgi:galactose-1-phosphate uridylyltransferase